MGSSSSLSPRCSNRRKYRLGLFPADPDSHQEILRTERLVRFDVVCSDRAGATDELLCVLDVGQRPRKLPHERPHCLRKPKSPILEIVAVGRIWSAHGAVQSSQVSRRAGWRALEFVVRASFGFRDSDFRLGFRISRFVLRICFGFRDSRFGFPESWRGRAVAVWEDYSARTPAISLKTWRSSNRFWRIEPLGQAATQVPQPLQSAALIEATCLASSKPIAV